MNWVDWIILITLLLGLMNGFREGFVRIVIGFAALIVAFSPHRGSTGTRRATSNRSSARACWRRFSAMRWFLRSWCCLAVS